MCLGFLFRRIVVQIWCEAATSRKLNPPEFLFNASCNQHDFYYWRGGTESDRLEADKAFYEAMLVDIQNYVVWYKRLSYKLIAYAYYKSVRLFGKRFFQYGTMKTKTDIDAYIIRRYLNE